MKVERFCELMSGDSGRALSDVGCNALEGLKIINSIMPNRGISGAGHDVIYSASIYEIIEAGITEEQVLKLRELNWMIDEDSLACFV
jgi:hypothetical protein